MNSGSDDLALLSDTSDFDDQNIITLFWSKRRNIKGRKVLAKNLKPKPALATRGAAKIGIVAEKARLGSKITPLVLGSHDTVLKSERPACYRWRREADRFRYWLLRRHLAEDDSSTADTGKEVKKMQMPTVTGLHFLPRKWRPRQLWSRRSPPEPKLVLMY